MVKTSVAKDIKLAERVIEAYSNGLDGLTAEECRNLKTSSAQCATLQKVLKTGPEGEVTQDERAKLAASGFSLDFIKTLAGDDGKKALQGRVKWLANYAEGYCTEFEWSQSDWELEEIKRYGADALLALPTLIKLLRCDYHGMHPAIDAAIISMGSNAVQMLMDAALSDVTVNRIAEVLARMGVDIVPEFFKRGYINNSAMINVISEAIRKMGADAVNVLTKMLDTNANRYTISFVFRHLGEFAIPPLIKALKNGKPQERINAIWALKEMRLEIKEIIAALAEALNDCAERVCSAASGALGKIGPNAKDAVPLLIALAESKISKTTFCDITDSLPQKERPPPGYSVFSNHCPHNLTASHAIEALGNIGPNAKAAVPMLIRFLDGFPAFIRQLSAEALGKIGGNARIALSHLENMERNDSYQVCRAAAKEAREKIEAEIL